MSRDCVATQAWIMYFYQKPLKPPFKKPPKNIPKTFCTQNVRANTVLLKHCVLAKSPYSRATKCLNNSPVLKVVDPDVARRGEAV